MAPGTSAQDYYEGNVKGAAANVKAED